MIPNRALHGYNVPTTGDVLTIIDQWRSGRVPILNSNGDFEFWDVLRVSMKSNKLWISCTCEGGC